MHFFLWGSESWQLYLENTHEWQQAQNGPSNRKKPTVTKIVKIISKTWGNALKIKLIIQQGLLEPYKPIALPPGPLSSTWDGTQAGGWPAPWVF